MRLHGWREWGLANLTTVFSGGPLAARPLQRVVGRRWWRLVCVPGGNRNWFPSVNARKVRSARLALSCRKTKDCTAIRTHAFWQSLVRFLLFPQTGLSGRFSGFQLLFMFFLKMLLTLAQQLLTSYPYITCLRYVFIAIRFCNGFCPKTLFQGIGPDLFRRAFVNRLLIARRDRNWLGVTRRSALNFRLPDLGP